MSMYTYMSPVQKGQSIFGSFMRKHIYVRADAITESNGLFTRDEGFCPNSTVLIHFWEICCFGFLNLPNFGRFSYPLTPFLLCVNKCNDLKIYRNLTSKFANYKFRSIKKFPEWKIFRSEKCRMWFFLLYSESFCETQCIYQIDGSLVAGKRRNGLDPKPLYTERYDQSVNFFSYSRKIYVFLPVFCDSINVHEGRANCPFNVSVCIWFMHRRRTAGARCH